MKRRKKKEFTTCSVVAVLVYFSFQKSFTAQASTSMLNITSRRGRLAARQEQHSAASVQANKDLENPHLSTKDLSTSLLLMVLVVPCSYFY